jgi:hypothetical protein
MLLLSVALVGAGLLAGQVLLVALWAALRPRGNIYAAIVAVAFLTAPLAAIADSWWFGRPLSGDGRVFLMLLHLSLGGLFFHFMTLPDRSVTLRILVELLLAPGQTLSVEALSRRYGVATMIASRLRQLAQGRFLTIAPDGALTLEPRGVWFARFVTGGRRLFRISSAN